MAPQTKLTPNQQSLVPKDKYDSAAIEHLHKLSATALLPLIPALLTWLQDRNWPIFEPVRALLLENPELVVGPLRAVLKGTDTEWIENSLNYLVKSLSREFQVSLKDEMERIRKYPTAEERREEVDILAGEILDSLRDI